MVRIKDQVLFLIRSSALTSIFFLSLFTAQAQQKQVRGTVKDATGKAVPSATVTIKGSAVSKVTLTMAHSLST
jgi:hypothetical protein